jgi:diacylglycerol kinase
MQRLIKSFYHAMRGLWFAIVHERNLQIDIAVAVLVIVLALVLKVSFFEFILLIGVIFLVFVAELLNTIIELIIDYVCPQYSQKVRIIKDLASGTVLIAAIGAIIVGIMIFYPHIIILFNK